MKAIFLNPKLHGAVAMASLLMACGGEPATTASSAASEAPSTEVGQANVIDDESQRNVVQIAMASPDHATLVKAVQAGDLVNSLANAGPFTVFAPTDAAFNELPKGALNDLLKAENRNALIDILEYHVAVGVYKPEQLRDGQVLGMVNGGNVTFQVEGDQVLINGARIVAEVPAANGLVCVIDKVLQPGN